jgi:hypothetical protein
MIVVVADTTPLRYLVELGPLQMGLTTNSESFESGGHSLSPLRIQTPTPSLRSQDLGTESRHLPFGFAVDPGRPSGNVERKWINGNGGEEVLEKLPAAIGLRRILGAPDAMLQFDYTDRCQSDSFFSEDGFDIGQKTCGGPALAFSRDHSAGVED